MLVPLAPCNESPTCSDISVSGGPSRAGVGNPGPRCGKGARAPLTVSPNSANAGLYKFGFRAPSFVRPALDFSRGTVAARPDVGRQTANGPPSPPPPSRNLSPRELAEVGAYAATDMNRNQT